jgi:hypothetical protein
MLILRGPAAANQIANAAIRRLVELRFSQVCGGEPYDYDLHGYMVVVEAGDSVDQIETEIGCSLLFDPFEDVPYGHPDFVPLFETLEVHHDEHGNVFYEILFLFSDGGAAITAIVPEAEGVDASMLSLCREYATPATEHADT